MEQFFTFFLRHFKSNSSVERGKAKVLVVIDVAGFFVAILLSIFYRFINQENLVYETLPISVITIIAFIFIWRGNMKVAGAIITSGLTIFLVINAIFNFPQSPTYNYFMNEYYLFLFLIIFSAMSASRPVFIINTAIIAIGSSYAYLSTRAEVSANIGGYSDIGFIEFMTMVFLIFTLSFYFTKFLTEAILTSEKNIEIVRKQNKEMQIMAKNISESSSNIAESSEQLSAVSENVSQRSSEQASTVEEVSASMEEMLASITINTENAKTSYETISKTSNNIDKNNKVLMATIELVNQVAKEITIISEIAKKTDILSINAAIEAAKADDKSSGFAVISQEIRKLADKSQYAAENIKSLSKKGIASSQVAHKALQKMMPEIKESAAIIKDMLTANHEQQNNAESINNSIIQLSEISSENSATAEEMSVSAEEMANQSEQLKELVKHLNNNIIK